MNPIALLPTLLLAGGIPLEPLTCTVTPRVINVGAFYNGARVRVEGSIAAGTKVVLTVTGSDRAESFSRRARFGPIWLNGGKLRISGAPSLFLRYSTGPVAAMLNQSEIARHHLDEESLMARMRIAPHSGYDEDSAVRNDYVALRKSGGTYDVSDGGIVIRESGRSASYALELRWPKRAPPGTYEVRAYEVAKGAVVREASASLSVVRIGFPAWLAGMAANQAPFYGMVAVLIGALAGFGIDRLCTLVFGKKRSVAH